VPSASIAVAPFVNFIVIQYTCRYARHQATMVMGISYSEAFTKHHHPYP
jgi:hypothetical protein